MDHRSRVNVTGAEKGSNFKPLVEKCQSICVMKKRYVANHTEYLTTYRVKVVRSMCYWRSTGCGGLLFFSVPYPVSGLFAFALFLYCTCIPHSSSE